MVILLTIITPSRKTEFMPKEIMILLTRSCCVLDDAPQNEEFMVENTELKLRLKTELSSLGVISGASKECQDHSPFCLSTERIQ